MHRALVHSLVGPRKHTEPPNPEPWLWAGLASAFAAWIIATFLAPNYDPLKFLGPQSSSAAGLAVLFLGAIISIRIYDYVNRRAEKRQLRHDYALSRVKDIYAPLWEETASLMELAGRYESAELSYGGQEKAELAKRGFAGVMKGPLRLFVDSELQALLSSFRATLPVYNKAWSTARNDLYDQARVAARELSGRPEGDGPTTEIANLLMTNDRHVWGATDFGEDALRYVRERFREMYVRIPGLKPNEADAAFDRLLARLRSLESAEALRRGSRTCLASGQRVIQRLEAIVRDPTSLVLDFES